MKENPAGIEQKDYSPSTLHLFRYNGPKMETLRERTAAALQLEQSIVNIDNSLHKLNLQKDDRLARLSQTEEELNEQLNNIDSSIACGTAYLKMRDEFPNLPPKDFMDFFKLCLKIDTQITENNSAAIQRDGGQSAALQILSRKKANRRPRYYEDILNKAIVHSPPGWFEGNTEAWKRFVANYSNFNAYLNPDALQSALLQPNQIFAGTSKLFSQSIFYSTFEGGFPDWFLENSDVTPEREIVERELIEDKEQKTHMDNELDRIEEHSIYLNDAVLEKAQKANARLRLVRQEKVVPDFEHFSDLILSAKVADIHAPNVTIARNSLDTAIKSYIDSENFLTDQEPIALFIERKLKEGKIMQSAQDPIDSRFISLFLAAFESIKAQQKDGSGTIAFETLRTTDKKAFGALNYDLKPFLEILPIDEISLLEDLLAESKDKPIELFIWDLAGTLSSNIKKKRDQIRAGSLHNLQRFTSSFLKTHSRWAYEQLQESLAGKGQRATSESYEQPISDIQQEIETTREEIAQGNLAGWQIFYTNNRSLDEQHLTEVGGQTLEEREEALQTLLLKEGNLPSIKPGSIIKAFDWIVTVPEEIEQMRIKKDVAGETFKKLKRAGLRIFYDMDPQNKKLIFFLHQKQAWSYGF